MPETCKRMCRAELYVNQVVNVDDFSMDMLLKEPSWVGNDRNEDSKKFGKRFSWQRNKKSSCHLESKRSWEMYDAWHSPDRDGTEVVLLNEINHPGWNSGGFFCKVSQSNVSVARTVSLFMCVRVFFSCMGCMYRWDVCV